MRALYTYAYGAPNASQNTGRPPTAQPPVLMRDSNGGVAPGAVAATMGFSGGGQSIPSSPLSRQHSSPYGGPLHSPLSSGGALPSRRESDPTKWAAPYPTNVQVPRSNTYFESSSSGAVYASSSIPAAPLRPLVGGGGNVTPVGGIEHGGPVTAAAASEYASVPVRRYTEGECFEWDWRV